ERARLVPHATTAQPTQLHPLVHRNTSDLSEQRFSSTFTGEEFFLKDHVVQGQKVLPGVAYLEMVRSALELALGTSVDGALRLQQVVWLRPFALFDAPRTLHVALIPQDSGEIGFEVYSEDQDPEPTVHAQGLARLIPRDEATLNLGALRQGMDQLLLSREQHGQAMRAVGFELGAAFQSVEQVHCASDGKPALLAELALPDR